MLAAPAVDFSFDTDSDWITPQARYSHSRGTSVGNSWKVTSIGRGFNWSGRQGDDEDEDADADEDEDDTEGSDKPQQTMPYASPKGLVTASPVPQRAPAAIPPALALTTNGYYTLEPLSISPVPSQPPTRPASRAATPASSRAQTTASISPSSPSIRARRRSSQQRVSLFAGRVSITPIDPHSPVPGPPPKLIRSGSQGSFLSIAASVEPPPPASHTLSGQTSQRSISEFVIQGEIGRGAYGLVKKAREMQADGTLGVRRCSSPLATPALIDASTLSLAAARD
jgi:protein-serine/threonine kinase